MTRDEGIAWRTTLEMLVFLGLGVRTDNHVGVSERASAPIPEGQERVEKTIGPDENEPVGGV